MRQEPEDKEKNARGIDPELERARVYLMEFLRDEFKRYPEVRLRALPPSVISSAERADGITAKTESREYFFETAWVNGKASGKGFSEIQALVRKIKDALPDRGEP